MNADVPFKIPSKYDHKTEMVQFCEEVQTITNIKEIYDDAEKRQEITKLLMEENKIHTLKNLYSLKKVDLESNKYNGVKFTPKTIKRRKIKNNSFIKNVVQPKNIVAPKNIRVSLLDIFKQGVVDYPGLKTHFFQNSSATQPRVVL